MRALSILALLCSGQQVLAFPALADKFGSFSHLHSKRVGFNAAQQKIDVSGAHAWTAPGSGDQRGPCPGLNALANHNYLPHNGVATIQQFIDATNKVYGMGLDLAGFLAIYGAVMDGDLKSWSIGGPPPPQGISYSHNKYEADVSPTRGDLYQYGDDYHVQVPQFEALYNKQANVPNDQANYDLPLLTQFRAERMQESIHNNPYFFNGPFTGVGVLPAAYT